MPDSPKRTCTARRKNGEACHKPPIIGGSVCTTHGGAAPQVRAKAQERLEAMVEPALARLRSLIEHADSDSVRLRATEMALDRALGKVSDKLKLSGDVDEPLEIVISRPNVPASDAS